MNKLKYLTISIILLMLLSLAGPSLNVSARPLAAVDPGLGAAASFSILAQTAITNSAPSVISGDVGMNASGASITGLTTGEVAGAILATDLVAPSEGILPPAVQADALAAFTTNIPGQASNGTVGPGLDGLIVVPGVYDMGAGLLSGGVITLNGPGIYIFRASSSLTSSGSINFINGADPCNLYWRVESLATINGSSFAGTILAGTGVHFGANVTLVGRALAIGGDVTLISDTITVPVCAAAPPTNTPTATATASNTPLPGTQTAIALTPTSTQPAGEVEEEEQTSVRGLPNTGGAPIRNEDFPWSLVIAGGFSAMALALGVRAYRRTHLPKQ